MKKDIALIGAGQPELQKATVSRRSSYQSRLEDLEGAWALLQDIGDLQLQRMDGLPDKKFFEQFENIVYERIYNREEWQFNECPLCGRFAQHSHSFD